MKILILGGYTPSLVNFRADLMKEMVRRGHEVVACAPEDDGTVTDKLQSIGVRFRQVPLERTGSNPLNDIKTLQRLEALFREEKPDKLLAYTIKPVIYGTLAAAKAGVPERYAMITGLGAGFEGDSLKRRLTSAAAKLLLKRALARASRIIVQNPDDRDDVVAWGLARKEQFEIVNGSGVDCVHFSPASLPDGPPVFLMIARLLIEKGVRVFAEAARAVKKEHPEARFILLGPLDDTPSTISEEEVQGWVAEGILEWRGGWTKDVRPALAEATVFVLPSYYREGTPRTILEAMAVGRPIITTDSPGCREPIEDGVQGFLVKPRDSQSLADAMRAFLNDPALAPKMAELARKQAVEKYEVGAVNDHVLRIMNL